MNDTEIAPDLGIIRVLVLDDHVMFAESLSRLLRDETDIDVVATTGNLREAVLAAGREQPDVVVLDFLLPDCDIALAASELRRAAPDVKLLVVTAYNDHAALVAALDARCDGFVTKDRAARDVVHAMRAIRAGRRDVSIDVVSQAWSSQPAPTPVPAGERLTPREREVLALLAGGRSSSDIAARLAVSVNTVRNHVQRIFTKLGAHSRVEAVAIAIERGLLDDPRRFS
jgi:two-component system, NarL family, nitrate/nitrite response regulator NarL